MVSDLDARGLKIIEAEYASPAVRPRDRSLPAPVLVGPNPVERPLFPSPPEQSRIPTMDCPKCGAAAMMHADDAGVRLSWACQCGQIRALMSGIAPANWRQGRAQALIGGVWQDVAAVRYMGDE